MTVTCHYCDACGTMIQADRSGLTVECGPLRSWTKRIDLCPACARRLRDQLDVGLPGGPAGASLSNDVSNAV